MSIDYYGCEKCGESIYEEYVGQCIQCGKTLCTDCLVNNDVGNIYAYNYGVAFDGTQEMADKYGFEISEMVKGELIEDTSIDPKYCPFCSGGFVHNSDLLGFVLRQAGLTKEEAITKFKEENNENKSNNA